MAHKPRSSQDPVLAKLDAILIVLKDLLILQGTVSGIKKDDLRRIVAVDSRRVSQIMKHLRLHKRPSGTH